VRSRDVVASFSDLFVSFRDSFVNYRDLLIIFDPTNGININNCHLLPINSALWFGGEAFGHLFFCLFGLLFFSLCYSKVTTLSLSPVSIILSGFGSSEPNRGVHRDLS
jgi:hypothetical protein